MLSAIKVSLLFEKKNFFEKKNEHSFVSLRRHLFTVHHLDDDELDRILPGSRDKLDEILDTLDRTVTNMVYVSAPTSYSFIQTNLPFLAKQEL